ncbi:alpha/beta fold hydrolase [Micromonospora sp. Llam7]|uniref:thioesterase domain-containing protein n=1 Tax=Micromonospora tarapacensis TaxID=2835305 RepID=UPI001C8345BA|nr:alpha/beta fold hydrolase [Micromonospora tarapacensis]MBX7265796.1 alpha/beta fold hydrolase [Micromonospora tarapacensis]
MNGVGGLHVLRSGGSPHLHLVHPGGGGITAYQGLAAALPQGWTVTASDDMGQGDSVELLAGTYLRELLGRSYLPDLLGGWSLGGLVAFQVARLLVAARRPPPPLVLLDTPPPGTSGAMPDRPRMNLEFVGMLWSSLGLPVDRAPQRLDGDDEPAMRVLAEALQSVGESLELEFLLTRLNIFRRHRRALVSYAPAKPIATPSLIIRGALGEDVVLGWRRLLDVDPTVVAIPGGHYSILAPPNLSLVAGLICELSARER